MDKNTYAAIAMALYEMDRLDVHDDESGVITIKPRKTPWSVSQQIILSR